MFRKMEKKGKKKGGVVFGEKWKMIRFVAAVLCLLATGDLLGQLSVDAVFDTGDDRVFKDYFCLLLESMNGVGILRVAIPCVTLATCLSMNALGPGRSTGDFIAAGVPSTVGLAIFSRTVGVVTDMCAGKIGSLQAQSTVASLHIGVAVILTTCLVGQLFGLSHTMSLILQRKSISSHKA